MKFNGWSSLRGLQCHVRWEDLSNLELTREIQTHWLQMKSGRYLSLWAIHLIMSIVFFVFLFLWKSPFRKFAFLDIDPSTITWQRVLDTNDRSVWSLHSSETQEWQAWQQYCLSADTWERSLWDRARQRRVWPGLANFQMYHFMNFISVFDLTNVLLQGDSVWHHCGQVK